MLSAPHGLAERNDARVHRQGLRRFQDARGAGDTEAFRQRQESQRKLGSLPAQPNDSRVGARGDGRDQARGARSNYHQDGPAGEWAQQVLLPR